MAQSKTSRLFFEILAALLVLGSLLFFYECVVFLSRRDYVAAVNVIARLHEPLDQRAR